MRSFPLFFWLTFSLSVSTILHAQHHTLTELQTEKELYLKAAGNQALVFQGKEQLKYPLHYLNHPFYLQQEYAAGELWYDGNYYPDVKLRFDTHRHEMVVLSGNPAFNVVLSPERVDSARLFGKTIIRMDNNEFVKPGYYIVHYRSRSSIIEYKFAYLQNFVDDNKLKTRFEFLQTIYIERNGRISPIRNLNSLLRIYPDRRAEIGRLIRKQGMQFRRQPAETLIEILKNISE